MDTLSDDKKRFTIVSMCILGNSRLFPSHAAEGDLSLQPLLSFVLPVRNAESTLKRDVGRLLELLPDLTSRFEILVIDDGSNDHTQEVADDLAREFPQVRLARHERPGGREAVLATARARATGDFSIVQEGATVSASELARMWTEHLQASDGRIEVPAIPISPGGLRPKLLERLTKWGEQLRAAPAADSQAAEHQGPHTGLALAAAIPTKAKLPISFSAHLRNLSRA